MQDVQTAADNLSSDERPVPLPLRNDTMLGVCAALGEDLGINANYLRVAIGSMVIFNVVWAIGLYLALGVIVGASRLLFPARRVPASHRAAGRPTPEANDAAAAPESLAA